MSKSKKSGNFRYSIEEILESDFFKALGRERVKEFIIKGRLLIKEECQEVLIRTYELFSSGRYEPDPHIERYINSARVGESAGNDIHALVEALEKDKIEREKLRNKLLKKSGLAGSEDSSPEERGKKEKERR